MSYHRPAEKGGTCKRVRVPLCNGNLKLVEETQAKFKEEHNGAFLSKPRAINILLSSIKLEK